ncbi:RCC1 domain-containing protein 1 isoform X3 [Pseudopipra pipra]|uniref:RCC1 domain-containing protein 1 isoform X3 n=1 Tax=Pseudopipra pipra TaxID=415032 RepID=UPI003139735A
MTLKLLLDHGPASVHLSVSTSAVTSGPAPPAAAPPWRRPPAPGSCSGSAPRRRPGSRARAWRRGGWRRVPRGSSACGPRGATWSWRPARGWRCGARGCGGGCRAGPRRCRPRRTWCCGARPRPAPGGGRRRWRARCRTSPPGAGRCRRSPASRCRCCPAASPRRGRPSSPRCRPGCAPGGSSWAPSTPWRWEPPARSSPGAAAEAGDLYMWGWNESGQLALPSKALVEERAQDDVCTGNAKLVPCQEQSAAKDTPFISIQAFPALLDLPQDLEVSGVSCGSRHTAVVTRGGELYTWGWGKYGQLGHGDIASSDQARRVEHLVAEGLRAEEVVCGPWTTYVRVLEP